jgi:[acyl-carrier-protein] S-malonyltransferase
MTKRAFVFAGQGAQYLGMGKDLAELSPACRALFSKADEVLGFELSKLCFEGPEETLTKTQYCQPAIFVTSVVCLKALEESIGGSPSVAGMAGLSLGEWTALHLAGAISFEDALRLIEARGRFMQESCEEQPGGMVSVVGLTAEQLIPVAQKAGVEIANINSEQQIVLSGDKLAMIDAEKLANEAGAKKTIPLKVAGAYHSRLMAGAAQKLDAMLTEATFISPRVTVVSNVTALPHGGPAAIRETVIRQITSPVRWVECINWFKTEAGVTDYTEFGPGKVLSGLIKRIDREAVLRNMQDASTLAGVAEALKQ